VLPVPFPVPLPVPAVIELVPVEPFVIVPVPLNIADVLLLTEPELGELEVASIPDDDVPGAPVFDVDVVAEKNVLLLPVPGPLKAVLVEFWLPPVCSELLLPVVLAITPLADEEEDDCPCPLPGSPV
jgi:hypothetical protein